MRLATGLAATAVMAALATAAMADESYIRVEAKRGAAAGQAAAAWQAQFGDVVTWPLAGGMTAIALGPVDAQEAAARLARLKAEGTIPADSFITSPATGTTVTALAPAENAAPADATAAPQGNAVPANPGAGASVAALPDSRSNAAADLGPDAADAATEADAAAGDEAVASYHVQLQAAPTEAAGRQLLTRWREQFPQVGLWQLPGGWYAIALPPETLDAAEARRAALIRTREIPADAFLAASERMGAVVDPPGEPTEIEAATEEGDAAEGSADNADSGARTAGDEADTQPFADGTRADPESPDTYRPDSDEPATAAPEADSRHADASTARDDDDEASNPAPVAEAPAAEAPPPDANTLAPLLQGSEDETATAGAPPPDDTGSPGDAAGSEGEGMAAGDIDDSAAAADENAAQPEAAPGDANQDSDALDTPPVTGGAGAEDATAESADSGAATDDAADDAATGDTTARTGAPGDDSPAEGEDEGAAAPAADTTAAAPGLAPQAQTPAEMPPLREVQEALRWAGYYDGDIDGLSGPATKAAIAREIESVSPGTSPAQAMVDLLARREAWRADLGLWAMRDTATGITLDAPTSRLSFDRVERGMAIYGPRDGSGAALILVAREGDAAALAHFAGFVTALGWVPDPQRRDERGRHVALEGTNDDHYGQAQLWLENGVIQGFVLIWPADDADNGRRLAIEATESFQRDASIPSLEAPAPAQTLPADTG